MKRRKKKQPKKNRICWCGKEFTLTNREIKNLLNEFELFCSENCLINYIKQVKKKPTTIQKNSPRVNFDFANYDSVTNQFYRSNYEVWFARCLTKHKIKFRYEPHAFFLGGHYYTPDFYIPEKELYIECKGLWRKGAKTKVRKLSEFTNMILLPSYFQNYLKHYKKWSDNIK